MALVRSSPPSQHACFEEEWIEAVELGEHTFESLWALHWGYSCENLKPI